MLEMLEAKYRIKTDDEAAKNILYDVLKIVCEEDTVTTNVAKEGAEVEVELMPDDMNDIKYHFSLIALILEKYNHTDVVFAFEGCFYVDVSDFRAFSFEYDHGKAELRTKKFSISEVTEDVPKRLDEEMEEFRNNASAYKAKNIESEDFFGWFDSMESELDEVFS